MMAYNIEDHNHRLAAWAASTSARASILCRFKVCQGVQILEASGFTPAFVLSKLPPPEQINKIHEGWRNRVIEEAKVLKISFTHGIAAKLINCYLKVRFVCAGQHQDNRVKALHPPVDEVLLKSLAKVDFGGKRQVWKSFRQKRWSKFDSETYQQVINLIRESLPQGQPLWMIEQYWGGHQ